VLRAPAERRVLAVGAVDRRLRVDRQVAELVLQRQRRRSSTTHEVRERVRDGEGLLARRLIGPRQARKVAAAEAGEELAQVIDGLRLAPRLERLVALSESARS